MKKVLSYVLVSILCLMVGACACFLVMNMTKTESKPTKKEEKNETVVLNSYDEEVTGVVKTIFSELNCEDPALEYFKSNSVKGTDISVESVYRNFLKNIYGEKRDYSREEFDTFAKELLGEDYVVDTEELSKALACADHLYDKETDTFKEVQPGCGCTYGPNFHASYSVSKATKTGDMLEVEFNMLFPSLTDEKDSEGYHKFFKDAAHTEAIEGLAFGASLSNVPSDNFHKPVLETADNFAKGGVYKVTFKENNGKYTFVSTERVK